MKMHEIPSPVPGCKAWRTVNNLGVICGREPLGPLGEPRWHLSISHAKRNPTWEEIRDLRYLLVPDEVTMAMILPPVDEYVNVHERCFHLYQLKEDEIAKPQIIT
jgi:hypothetical protein